LLLKRKENDQPKVNSQLHYRLLADTALSISYCFSSWSISIFGRPDDYGHCVILSSEEIEEMNSTSNTKMLSFDNDGNELTNGAGQSYTWDVKNELTQITQGSNTYQFGYDALGHRISETDNGTLTKQWVWDGSKMAEERNASNVVQKRFFAQGEQILGTSYYYTRDHLGSIREMTNSSGAIVARYDYDPYGRVTTITGTVPSDFQYAGYYAHQPSGLNLTLFRAYDPNTGRWLSRDPAPDVEMREGPNVYEYSYNDSINFLDLLGLSGTLTIYSQGGGASYGFGSHSWISFTDDQTGQTSTYGTWGPGSNPLGSGLLTDAELGRSGGSSRCEHITDAQQDLLYQLIDQAEDEGPSAWNLLAPCSAFAADTWDSVTGENLDDTDLFGISNPTSLASSINSANSGGGGYYWKPF
jgi:RHS repeat-associated protein